MLRDVGCRYVIVGHSERRALFGETDALVARKFVAAQAQRPGARAVRRRDARASASGRTHRGGRRASSTPCSSVSGVGSLARAVIAYEPVWAIGTGRTATPEQAQDVHAFIRGGSRRCDATIAGFGADPVRRQRQGVNAGSCSRCRTSTAGSIGGASLKAEEFAHICAAAG